MSLSSEFLSRGRRSWLALLPVLLGALAAMLLGTTAYASAPGVAENRVGAFNVSGEVLVEPPENVSAGQVRVAAESRPGFVVANGVAADAATEIPAAARTRPSFRRGTERDALASAPQAADAGAMCPGCGTPIGRGQIEFGGRLRRDFDLDHYGQTWAERIRAMPSDITRPEVIEAYQEMVRATCPICNQSHILEGR